MLIFYLVRHGNTEHNKNGIVIGQSDSALTNAGLENANFIADKLCNIGFKVIYTSDLGRASATAFIIAKKLEMEEDVFFAKELRELDFGIYAGRPKTEVVQNCPEFKTDVTYTFPNGENYNQLMDRVLKFIKNLEEKYPDQTLLLVTHSGVIRAINSFFRGWNFQDHLKLHIPHEYIGKFVLDNNQPVSCEELGPDLL